MFATTSNSLKVELGAEISCIRTQQNEVLLASGKGREGALLSAEQQLCFPSFLPCRLVLTSTTLWPSQA